MQEIVSVCNGFARRFAVASLLVAALAAMGAFGLPAPAEAQMIRKSIEELTDAEVMSLRRGFETMMSRNSAPRGSANFRRSWVYWANMHAHFGQSCRGPITGSGMAGVQLWNASNPNETATWCKCAHGSDQFLTWHRMFLFYFERVLRQAAQDPNLTLPYWDYETDPELPLVFREATYVNADGQQVPNPLRAEARRAALNSGAAGIGPGTASASNAMTATTYPDFRRRLEQGPHGPVHCAIGSAGCPSGLMGSVPAAALDPIFYLHHANIDRLYECWLQQDEAARLPQTQGVLNRTFSFVDGGGAVRTRRVRDMLTTTQLGYGYAEGAGCPAPIVAAQEVAEMEIELQRGLTTVPLDVETDAAPPGALEARRAAGPAAATVVVDGLTAAKAPGVLYNVYLANDAGAREQIGVIDFFAFDDGGHEGHAGHDASARRFEFDATAAMEKVGLDPSAKPNLIFEPTTGLTNSTPEAAADAIAADADVKFRRAWLRLD